MNRTGRRQTFNITFAMSLNARDYLFICGEGYFLFKLSPERTIIGYTCIAYKVQYSSNIHLTYVA